MRGKTDAPPHFMTSFASSFAPPRALTLLTPDVPQLERKSRSPPRRCRKRTRPPSRRRSPNLRARTMTPRRRQLMSLYCLTIRSLTATTTGIANRVSFDRSSCSTISSSHSYMILLPPSTLAAIPLSSLARRFSHLSIRVLFGR